MRILTRILMLCAIFVAHLMGENLDSHKMRESSAKSTPKSTQKRVIKKSNSMPKKPTKYSEMDFDYIDESAPKTSKDLSKKVATSIIDRKEPSGWIVGGGISLANRTRSKWWAKDPNDGIAWHLSVPESWDFGLNLLGGYKWFFGRGGFGMRLYGDYNARFINNSRINRLAYTSHNFALNYDLLFNWVKTKSFKMGMFFGLGIGTNIADFSENYKAYGFGTQATFSLNGNLGARFVIFNNHAIETLIAPRISLGVSHETTCYYYTGCHTYSNSATNEIILPLILRYVYTF